MSAKEQVKTISPKRPWEFFRDSLNGDAERGCDVLWRIACAIRDNEEDWWREVLAEMLERVAVGDDANIAMLVKRPNNAPRKRREDRHRIFMLVTEAMKKTSSRMAACKAVAAQENIDRPRVTKSGVPKPHSWRTIEDTFIDIEKEYKARVEGTALREGVALTPKDWSTADASKEHARNAASFARYVDTFKRVYPNAEA